MANELRAFQWADRIELSAQFRRSIHLERDLADSAWLSGYVVTPLVRSTAARLARGLGAGGAERAFSIIGPYGTGKSAFALFFSHLLGLPETRGRAVARHALKQADGALYDQLFGKQAPLSSGEGLCPVVATGERRPLQTVLLRALQHAVNEFWSGPGQKSAIVREINGAARTAETGERLACSAVAQLFERAAKAVRHSARGGLGLLVVLDEAGKTLEYAAESRESDVQLLQELAELANRSGEYPILFITVLQQAIEQYAQEFNSSQREEWAKVQGRFESITFREGTDQILRLLGMALDRRAVPPALAHQHGALAKATAEAWRPGAAAMRLLADALPLHPVTALCLSALSRSAFSQNERSLFAFLGALEPLAFQEYLHEAHTDADSDVFYPPYRLFDYVVNAFGPFVNGRLGKQWAQVQEALSRLPETATQEDAHLVKTVGVLTTLGQSVGLAPSRAVLELALSNGTAANRKKVGAALRRLEKASILVHRKYKDAYQLWEGSDLDIDQLTKQARVRTAEDEYLVDLLRRVAPPHPAVARRHLLETGTLRYFEIRYVKEGVLTADAPIPPTGADGLMLLVLGKPTSHEAELARQVRNFATLGLADLPRPLVLVLPRGLERLRDLALELAALERVRSGTPELQSDRVARREVEARISELSQRVRTEVAHILNGRSPAEWHYGGRAFAIRSPRQLAQFLSDVFDETYGDAPVVQNELLNRERLSSAAAAARRLLIEAMVERAERPRLGFQGHPAEYGMYRSFVERHGLHRPRPDGAWTIAPPDGGRAGSLLPAWRKIDALLDRAQERPVGVAEVYETLKSPPFGLKDGVLPVLCVAYMLAGAEEIALYEDGRFVPTVSAALTERLLRTPAKFQIQRYALAGKRAELVGGMLAMFGRTSEGATPNVLPLVRDLVRTVADLPEYATRTQALSETARRVRDTILAAKEPAKLLFRDLPAACGFPPIRVAGNPDLAAFVPVLRAALLELQGRYDALIREIEAEIAAAFGLGAATPAWQRELAARGRALGAIVVDAQLRSFLARLDEGALTETERTTSVATLLSGKPPEFWNDQDRQKFTVAVAALGQQFRTLETLAVGLDTYEFNGRGKALRLSVIEVGEPEHARVVTVPEEDWPAVDALYYKLKALASGNGEVPSDTVLLAGLGLLAKDLLAGRRHPADTVYPKGRE